MASAEQLLESIQRQCTDMLISAKVECHRCVLEVKANDLKALCLILRDDPDYKFECLMDVCGVDYSHYGISEWEIQKVNASGYSRAVTPASEKVKNQGVTTRPRFGVVYQLLSVTHNHRIMLRTFPEGEPPTLDSVHDIWPSANWNEREVFDLFGILFRDHPDLRRILTDYGFIGYPFRKDFPLTGEVEVRYDATTGRVVYEPVDIKPRTLVPKVIRKDETDLNFSKD